MPIAKIVSFKIKKEICPSSQICVTFIQHAYTLYNKKILSSVWDLFDKRIMRIKMVNVFFGSFITIIDLFVKKLRCFTHSKIVRLLFKSPKN